MIINQLTGLDTYITFVLNDYGVSDLIAYCYILGRLSRLGDAQLSCCSFSCYCSCCTYLSRIIASYGCCICLYYVHDRSGINVILGYRVTVIEGCCCSGRKFKCLASKVRMVIDQLTGLDAYVTFVLDNYGVSDLVAYSYVCGRFSFLGDAQLSCCSFCSYCCCCTYLIWIVSSYCCRICLYYVHDRSGINVSLGYCVGVLEGC